MKLIVTLMMCLFFLGLFPPIYAGEEDIDLTIEGKVLSAKLKEIPLKIILEKLEREKGIWFRGDSSLLEEEITVQFTELSLEKGLKRILSSINHSLLFDRNERLVGVIAIGKGAPEHGVSEGTRRTILLQRTNEQENVNRYFTEIVNSAPKATAEGREGFTGVRDCPSPGSSEKISVEESEDFKVTRNLGPPGGPVQVTAEEREAFTVIRNCPPPGGSTDVSPEEQKEFEVMRNLPPPGGPFEVSSEELENFKVIENCPPP